MKNYQNKGRVKFFNENEGYGIIKGECGREFFVCYKNILDEGYKVLDESETVIFDIIKTDKRLEAINIRKIDEC